MPEKKGPPFLRASVPPWWILSSRNTSPLLSGSRAGGEALDWRAVQDRQWHRHVLVDILPLVVVFRIELAIRPSDGLRRFISLEAQVASLMFFSHFFVAESVVAEHEIVVGLQVFGIDGQHLLQNFHGVRIFSLKKQNAAKIVQRHPIMRV